MTDKTVDATNSEGRLLVRTLQEDCCAIVEIFDSGPGGAQGDPEPHLQTVFFREGRRRRDRVGLDIVRRNGVGRHSGDIRIGSRPGETRFPVRLTLDHRKENGR